MPTMPKIVNPEDKNIWARQYNVILNAHAETLQVYADHEQDALDYAIDHAWSRGWIGYFLDDADLTEIRIDGFLDDYVSGGNEGRYLSSMNVSIVDVTGDKWRDSDNA